MDTLRELEGEARALSLGLCVQDGCSEQPLSFPQPLPAPSAASPRGGRSM